MRQGGSHGAATHGPGGWPAADRCARALLTALAALTPACPAELPVAESVRYACTGDHDCPAFQRCRDGACQPVDASHGDLIGRDLAAGDAAGVDRAGSDGAARDGAASDGAIADLSRPDAAPCVNQALQFTGSQWLAADDTARLDGMGTLTVEAWIRPTAQSLLQSGHVHIVSHHDNNLARGYLLAIVNRMLSFRIYDGSGPHDVSSSVTLTADRWYHAAGSYDGQTLRVFVDGVVRGADPIGSHGIADCECELRVGNSATVAGYFFGGVVDEVRISRGARYLADFARPTAPWPVDGDAVVIWHLDEGAGQEAADATGAVPGRLGYQAAADNRDPQWSAIPCLNELGG